MSDTCQHLHEKVTCLPRFSSDYAEKSLPANGIYFVFENGEKGHGGDRIVRVGTHDGDDNLGSRLKEHLITANKDRSIFRKHIGRAILNKRVDSYLSVWNRDMTSRTKREKYSHLVEIDRQRAIEAEVSSYITSNLRFAAIAVEGGEAERKGLEENLLSTLAQCPMCHASKNWLGSHHPRLGIRQSGLWNVQGLRGKGISWDQLRELSGR